MSRAQSITLRDFDAILPQYLVIHHIPTEGEWRITGIEILDENKVLLADDVRFDELPKPSQMAILGALNTHQHEEDQRRRVQRRLWADIQSDKVAMLALDCMARIGAQS